MGFVTIKEVIFYEMVEILTGKTIDKDWAIKAMLIPPGKINADYSYLFNLKHLTSLLTEIKTRCFAKINNLIKLINIYFHMGRHLRKNRSTYG